MLKILILYPIDPFGIKIGGIESVIRDMISYLIKGINAEVEVVGISLHKKLKIGQWHQVNFEGRSIKFFPVLEVSDPNRKTFVPLTLKYALSLLRWKNKINFSDRLLIFHRIEPAFVLYNIKAKKILFVHGDIRYFNNKFSDSKWRYFPWLYFLVEKLFIKQMALIFVATRAGCEYYKNIYTQYASRFHFFPIYYDSEKFFRMSNVNRNEILGLFDIPLNKKVILYVGRLEPPKNPLLLVETFALINRQFPETVLVIIGEGSMKKKMVKRIKNLGLSQNVVFLGKKTQTDIAKIMNVSDVLLLTSAFEGMPRVVLEALACGLPVVSPDTGEVKLVIKDGLSGKVVASSNPKDIADAVITVLKNPPSPELVLNECISYDKEFVIKKLINHLEKVWNE